MSTDCPRFLDLLLSSLDEPLAPADQEAFEIHLAACPSCAARLKEHVVLREALRDMSEEPISPAPFTDAQVGLFVGAMKDAWAGRRRDAGGSARTA
jgi:anti-sigma factor RsiW